MLYVVINWTALSAIAMAVAATAAAWSLIQFRGEYYRKLLADPPRFRITDPGVREGGETGERFKVGMNNYGKRPAEDVVVDVEIVDEELESTLTEGTHSLINEIPPSDEAHPWWGEFDKSVDNLPKYYVFFGIWYRDGFQGREYAQQWFLSWEGVDNGKISRQFRHIKDPEKADRLERYFRDRIDELVPEPSAPKPFGWTLGAGIVASTVHVFDSKSGRS